MKFLKRIFVTFLSLTVFIMFTYTPEIFANDSNFYAAPINEPPPDPGPIDLPGASGTEAIKWLVILAVTIVALTVLVHVKEHERSKTDPQSNRRGKLAQPISIISQKIPVVENADRKRINFASSEENLNLKVPVLVW